MKGLPVLAFGIIGFLCILWFMRILKIDSRDYGRRGTFPVEYAVVVFPMLWPFVFAILWLLMYIPVNMLAKLPELNLGLTLSITNSLVAPVANLALALSLLFIFNQNRILRMRVPLVLCSILLLGGLIFNLILIFQDHSFSVTRGTVDPLLSLDSLPAWIKKTIHAFSNLSKVSIVTIFILVKSYLGPLATGYVLCSLLYSHFVIGSQVDMSIFVLGPLLDWALEVVPYFWASLYLVLQVSYNVILNGFETVNDFNH